MIVTKSLLSFGWLGCQDSNLGRAAMISQKWLGRQDSNLGMVDPKSTALPLGHARSSVNLPNRRHVAIISC